MPAKDIDHEAVKNALIKDGWTITHDPYRIEYGHRDVYVDLGAERVLAAEKNGEKIAVELKSFISASEMKDLESALGQYVFYQVLLNRTEPERRLFLAVAEDVYVTTLDEPIARAPLEDLHVRLVVFDPEREVIVRWIT